MSISHLHIHTHYSLSDGICIAEDLFRRAEETGAEALAITDHMTLAGVFPFMHAGLRHPGVKPVFGCEVELGAMPGSVFAGQDASAVLLAKDLAGYHNLVKVVSSACLQAGSVGSAFVSHEVLRAHSEGLICLLDCSKGAIAGALVRQDDEGADALLRWFLEVFADDFYLEVPCLAADARPSMDDIVALSDRTLIKAVATSRVRYTSPEDASSYARSIGRDGESVGDEYLKTEDELLEVFSDYPDLVDNTMEVSGKVSRYDLRRSVEFPHFPVPEDLESRIRGWIRSDLIDEGAYDDEGILRSDEEFDSMCLLCHLVYEGARAAYGRDLPAHVKERCDRELGAILRVGAADYFLICWDLVTWARGNGLLVGPGRGRAPGSIVAYCLGITDVDPLRYCLLFERFMNGEEGELPDIDIDLDEDGRWRVLSHLCDKYGVEHVALASAYGILVPGHPDYDKSLDGIIRRKGINACSVLLSRDCITDYIPVAVHHEPTVGRAFLLSQMSSFCSGRSGVMQLDLIGQGVLSRMNACLEEVRRLTGEEIDLRSIPMDDPQVFDLYGRGDTGGVFHFESASVREMLPNVRPTSLEELMALEALFRPDAVKAATAWLAARSGTPMPQSPFPQVRDVLSGTFGVLVFQEQVMMIAQMVTGLGEDWSDLLRRAICRQDGERLAELHADFLIASNLRGHTADELEALWQSWVDAGRSLFNKSHAAAYAILSYRTAWLKVHYPDAFSSCMLHGPGEPSPLNCLNSAVK